MTGSGVPKLYRFVDNDDRVLCEVIAVTYEEACEKAVSNSGSKMPLKADFFIEMLAGNEQAIKRKRPRKHAFVAAIKGTGLFGHFFSKSGQ